MTPDKEDFILRIIARFSKQLQNVSNLNQLTTVINQLLRTNFEIIVFDFYINSEQNDSLILSSKTIRENGITDFKKIKNGTHEKIIEQVLKTRKATIFSLNKKEHCEKKRQNSIHFRAQKSFCP